MLVSCASIAAREAPGGIGFAERLRPPAFIRHEHIFIVAPLADPVVVGTSPGVPCPVAPTALISAAVNSEQTGFDCAWTLKLTNISTTHNGVMCRMR